VISVEELLDNVWTDVVVTPDSVYTTIAVLRRALGDDSKEAHYIVNVPRRGYRLVAPVTQPNQPVIAPPETLALPPPAAATQVPLEPRPRHKPLWVHAARAAVVLAVLGYLAVEKPWVAKPVPAPVAAALPPAPVISAKSIAVLPFLDMSEAKDQEYFATGLAVELLDLLVKLPQLEVKGLTSWLQFKGRAEDVRAIGDKLGVAYLVTGSVRKSGNRIRVTAQLVETRSGAHLWSESYDRDVGDVLVLEDQIAASIARALQVAVVADSARPLRHLQNIEAYNLYLRGLAAYDLANEGTLIAAQRYFEQALTLDHTFLRAAEALALTDVAQAIDETVTPRDAWKKAKTAAEAALRIDATSASAHGVIGLVHGLYDFDWDAAEVEFGKAFALNSRDPMTWDFAAQVSQVRGEHDKALQRIGTSLTLDPLSPYALQDLGIMLWANGDLDGAESAWTKRVAVSPKASGSHYYLAQIRVARGEREMALREADAETDFASSRQAALAIVYHALGRRGESDAALTRLLASDASITWPTGVAMVYAQRGQREEALKWLEKGYQVRDPEWMMLIRSDSLVGGLRDDPRYKALLRKMNLRD